MAVKQKMSLVPPSNFWEGILGILDRWMKLKEAQHEATLESTAVAIEHMKKNNELIQVQIETTAAAAGLDKRTH